MNYQQIFFDFIVIVQGDYLQEENLQSTFETFDPTQHLLHKTYESFSYVGIAFKPSEKKRKEASR